MVESPAPATPVEKLRAISRELLDRTKARLVNWIPRGRNGRPPETAYELVLPDSRVSIIYTRPSIAADSVTLRFQNLDAVTVDEWRVEEPDYDPDEGRTLEQADPNGDWRLLNDLFGEVHREATGYDRVLSDVELALQSLGPIGQPAPPESLPKK